MYLWPATAILQGLWGMIPRLWCNDWRWSTPTQSWASLVCSKIIHGFTFSALMVAVSNNYCYVLRVQFKPQVRLTNSSSPPQSQRPTLPPPQAALGRDQLRSTLMGSANEPCGVTVTKSLITCKYQCRQLPERGQPSDAKDDSFQALVFLCYLFKFNGKRYRGEN